MIIVTLILLWNWEFSFSTFRFHFDPASGTLSLSLVQCDDSGWYSCVASDGSETVMKRAYLTVLCGTGEVAYNIGGVYACTVHTVSEEEVQRRSTYDLKEVECGFLVLTTAHRGAGDPQKRSRAYVRYCMTCLACTYIHQQYIGMCSVRSEHVQLLQSKVVCFHECLPTMKPASMPAVLATGSVLL